MLEVEELRHFNKDGNYFLMSTNIPREPKGDIPLSAEETTLHSLMERKEHVTRKIKGKEIEDMSFGQPTFQKKSRSRVIDKTKDIQTPSKPCTKSFVKTFPMHIIHIELVEGENEGIYERHEELSEENVNSQEMKQQLKKAQHIISQLYQENKELRRQLAERIIETLA